MAIFDQSIVVQAVPTHIVATIKASVAAHEQFITLRPDTLLIALRDSVGYVYLLRPGEGGLTYLRLLTDDAQTVREAFRGRQPKEALIILTTASTNSDPALSQAIMTQANAHLAAIKRDAENAGNNATLSPDTDINPTSLSTSPKPEAPIDPMIAAIFAKKPLPGAGTPLRSTSRMDNSIVAPTPASASGNDPVIASIFAKKPLPATGTLQMPPGDIPWNPDRLMFWILFFSPIAGIGMGLNWRRLGKPQWMWTTIILSIAAPIILIVSILGIAASLKQLSSSVAWGLILILFGLNWGYFYGLYYLQRGGYRVWHKTGSIEALMAHQYKITDGIAAGTVTALAVIGIALAVSYFTSRPITFNSADMTITYPNTWTAQDINQVQNCSQANLQCLIAVTDSQFHFTSILIAKVADPTNFTASDALNETWLLLQQKFPDAQMDGVDKLTISGISGVRRYYSLTALETGDRHYGMQIYFVKGQTLYEFTAESLNKGIFDEERSNIDQFIAGITVK